MDSSSRFTYVENRGDNTVSMYAISSTTGAIGFGCHRTSSARPPLACCGARPLIIGVRLPSSGSYSVRSSTVDRLSSPRGQSLSRPQSFDAFRIGIGSCAGLRHVLVASTAHDFGRPKVTERVRHKMSFADPLFPRTRNVTIFDLLRSRRNLRANSLPRFPRWLPSRMERHDRCDCYQLHSFWLGSHLFQSYRLVPRTAARWPVL